MSTTRLGRARTVDSDGPVDVQTVSEAPGRLSWRWRLERRRLIDSLRGRRLLANPRVGFMALVVGWGVAVLFGLKWGPGNALQSFGTSLLTAALTSLTFGVFLYFGSNRRIARRLRAVARTTPAALLEAESATEDQDVTPRVDLYEDLAKDLSEVHPVGPQLIVGEVGAGKTTALVGLMRFLAGRGLVPVYVSLRGREELDFASLAHDRFIETVDEHVATPADAERVWRWLYRSKRLVVLADDLDEALPTHEVGRNDVSVRRALSAARRKELALVVTSRPIGVPESLAVSATLLEPLAEELAVRYALTREASGDEGVRERIEALVRHGHLSETPFYLSVVGDLAHICELPEPASDRYVVRFSLLHGYESALCRRKLATDAPIGPEERTSTLDALRRVALREINAANVEIDISRVIESQPEADPLKMIDAAERLALIERDLHSIRFVHEIVQSYLASGLLVDDDQELQRVCRAARTPRCLNALILAAAANAGAEFAGRTCRYLLDSAKGHSNDWGLVMVRAAADIARPHRDTRLDDSIAAAAHAYAPADIGEGHEAVIPAGSLTKRAAVPRLSQLHGEKRWHLWLNLTYDPDFTVRWAAASALCEQALGAYQALQPRFDDYLQAARELHETRPAEKVDDWRDRPVFRLKLLGWVLPSLATGLDQAGHSELAEKADEQWEELARLERAPITCQKGLEASVAQGLKADAWRLRARGSGTSPVRLAKILARVGAGLAHAEFWYSRIQLVHAIALVGGAAPAINAEASKRLAEVAASHREHPFTAEAARLAARSMATTEWGADVWGDEGTVVGARCALSNEAAQLVGDITLALNLNEQGSEEQRERFGTRDDLPHCLSTSPDRGEILGTTSCATECAFNLCPYYRPATETAHREISKSFCRQQRRIARKIGLSRSPAIGKSELSDFWRGMEERARV
jgi:hypothetical protein